MYVQMESKKMDRNFLFFSKGIRLCRRVGSNE